MPWQEIPNTVALDQGAPSAAPSGMTELPPDAQLDDTSAQPNVAPDGGFTNAQKDAIRNYIPKAKDAADLERYSNEVSGGHAHIGNAQQILDLRDKGQKGFSWAAPTVGEPLDAGQPSTIEDLRNVGKAFTEHVANAAVGDYGPEIGGFLRTALDPGAYGDFGANLDRNVAHERAILSGDSEGHGTASILGELTGVAATAPVGGAAADTLGLGRLAEHAPRFAGALKAALGGAVYGSGAAGPGNRAAGAVTGAALGTATDAAIPVVGRVVGKVFGSGAAAAASPEAVDAAGAAQDLGITLPRFALSDADRAKAAALEQKPFGAPVRQAATEMVDTSKAARDQIANDVGTPATTAPQLGDQTLDTAVKANTGRRAALGAAYEQAKSAADGVTIAPTNTVSAIDNVLGDEQGRLAGSKVAPLLATVKQNIQNAGQITIQQARDLRTDLRDQLTNEAGATPTNADRITNQVMQGVNADMASGLTAAGKQNALNLFKQADAGWAQQRALEDDVLKPFLGDDFKNWGEEVAKKINSDVKGNGTRLARFLTTLPEDQANNVRATIISHLGSSTDGAQNAAGDSFSLNTFLTNWNNIKGARRLIFTPETYQSLDKLAKVAQVAKASEGLRNKSNTGRVISSLALGSLAELGGGAALVTGDVKPLVFGAVSSSLMAARQYGAAKLLANPDFAKKLAAMPLRPQAAQAFWSRPWVKQMQLKNPAIAGEIQTFQRAFLATANDNGTITSAVASPDTEQQNQQQ